MTSDLGESSWQLLRQMNFDTMHNIDLSDDEGAPMDQETLENRKETKLRDWDLFQILPPDEDTDLVEDQKCYLFLVKSLKVLAYIFTFLIVLVGAVITKSVTLLMTSQLEVERNISYCRNDMKDRQYISTTSLEERISWTWAIYFAFLLPECLAFLRGLRKWVFKGQQWPTLWEFAFPFLCETAHTIGLALFVYLVLPTMDAVKGAMLTNAVCLIPAVLGLLSRGFDKTWIIKCILDVVAIMFQLSALLVWPLFVEQMPSDRPWILPIALILISFGWFENFVEPESPFDFIRTLANMKKRLRSTRYITYTFLPVYKAGLFLLCMLCCVWIKDGSFTLAFDKFDDAFSTHNFTVRERRPQVVIDNSQPDTNRNYTESGRYEEESIFYSVQHTIFAHMVAAYGCYIVAKFTCKICIQAFSFAFPILLAVPSTVILLVILCTMRDTETCFWDDVMPGYLFWTCPEGDFWSDFIGSKDHAWVWILWILSQTWITIHVWQPKGIRLARTEKMFTTPMFNSLLLDQSLAFNRRRDEDSLETEGVDPEATAPEYTLLTATEEKADTSKIRKEDSVPQIYACATMWHETREEMIEMLKSVFRMDSDQCARRMALKYFEYVDPGYYEFETHIFFDDAFQLSDPKDWNSPMIINTFVRDFLGTLEEAASHVHQEFVKLKPPKKIPTPYGGRLEYTLPGLTKLIVHIKDKSKIRHKKRWSQVMYMYYLLGHKLMERPIDPARKEVVAENTFILALDGDIDFQPNAVELLVDLMKKNKNLGAACGRIHPIGSGPMVWYQKFEYAVGHWLQKATEHVFGCVLCSPGCFSLFRGKALMDDNVMAKYTTVPTEPKHYVQYDQGEDRWLCTLLLQRGYRVEYSAASDAKTHAPEGFREFYNQRRRWVPSTMANIMDLLLSYEKVVKINPDISFLYICYQIIMMVGTILGPGTIFLMLVGAFATAFNLDQWSSFLYNFIPILIFIIVCFLCKTDIQLTVAEILSVIYGLAMVAVIVAIALQVTEDGLFAPSSIFLVAVALSFIIAGIIHPMEFGCLPHGFLYYITIPSMYLLLMIYSLFNLNNVSWGTREGVKIKSKQELEAEAKEAEEAAKQKKKGLFFGLLPGMKDENDQEGSFELSFAGLFKLMCCVKDRPNEEKMQLARMADTLQVIARRIEQIERAVEVPSIPGNSRRVSLVPHFASSPMDRIQEELYAVPGPNEHEDQEVEIRIPRDDLMNPFWIEDKDLRKAEVDFLTGSEILFWQELIEKYLKPIDADKKKEKQMAGELKELRNKVSFAFLMINAVFVILVFLLQLEKETIHINWPFGGETNVTYQPLTSEVYLTTAYLELEPIGLVFVGFFGIILLTQFIGMCFHRFETLSHILAATTLSWCTRNTKTITKEAALQKHGVGLIRRLQHAKTSTDVGDREQEQTKDVAGRRKTIANLERQRFKKKGVDNLENNFKRNFRSIALNAEKRNSKVFSDDRANTTFKALQQRRSTVLHRKSSVVDIRRKSQAFEDAESRAGSVRSMAPSTSSSVGLEGDGRRQFRRNKSKSPHRTRSNASRNNHSGGEDIEMYNV